MPQYCRRIVLQLVYVERGYLYIVVLSRCARGKPSPMVQYSSTAFFFFFGVKFILGTEICPDSTPAYQNNCRQSHGLVLLTHLQPLGPAQSPAEIADFTSAKSCPTMIYPVRGLDARRSRPLFVGSGQFSHESRAEAITQAGSARGSSGLESSNPSTIMR